MIYDWVFPLTFITLSPSVAVAQAVSATPLPPTFLNPALVFIANPQYVAGVTMAAEIAMRLVPTKNALSFFVVAKYVCDGCAAIFSSLSSLMVALTNVAQNSQNKAS